MIKSQVRSTSKLQSHESNQKWSTPVPAHGLNRSHQKQISLITASMVNREKQNKSYRMHADSGSLTQRQNQNSSLKKLNLKTLNTDRSLDNNISKGNRSKQLSYNHSVQLKQHSQTMRKKYIYNTPQLSKNNESVLDCPLSNNLKNFNITMHDIHPIENNHKIQDMSTNPHGRQQISSIIMKSKQIFQKNIKQPINEQSQNLQHSHYNPQKQPQIVNVPKFPSNQHRNTKQFRYYNHNKNIDHKNTKDSLESSKQRKSQLRSDRFIPSYNYTHQYHNQSVMITEDLRQKCNNHKEKQVQYKLQKENIDRMHSQIEALLRVVNKTKNTTEKSCVLSEYSDRMIQPLTLTLPVSMKKRQSSSQLSASKNKQNPSKTQRVNKVYQYSNINLQQNHTPRQKYEPECDKQIFLDLQNKMGKKSWEAQKGDLPHQVNLHRYFLPAKRNADNNSSSKKSLYNRKNMTVDVSQNATHKYRCRIQQSKIVPLKSPTFTPFQTPNSQSHLRIQPVLSQQLSNFPSHINQNTSRLNIAQKNQMSKKYSYKQQNQQNWQQYEQQSSQYAGLIDQQILRIRQRIQNSEKATRQMQNKYLNNNNNILNNTYNKNYNKTHATSKYTNKNVSPGRRGISPTNAGYNVNKLDYTNYTNNVNISSFNPQINPTQTNNMKFTNANHNQNTKNGLSNTNTKPAINSNYDSNKKNKKNQCVQKLASIIDKQIAKDMQLRELREQFMSMANEGNMKKNIDLNDDKWKVLSTKLERKGYYYDEKQLKQLLEISSDETNPFNSVSSQGKNNCSFDKLCQNICEELVLCQKFWTDHIVSCLNMNQAEQSSFGPHTIDLNKKGYLSIEDIVCFVNLYTGKFYKNRDVMLVFKRFCRRGALDARKNKISFQIFNDIVFGRNEY